MENFKNDTDGGITNDVIDAAVPKLNKLVAEAHVFADKTSAAVSDVAEIFNDKSTGLKKAHNKMMKSGRDKVREQPATAVVVAVSVSMVVGFILGKIMSSR